MIWTRNWSHMNYHIENINRYSQRLPLITWKPNQSPHTNFKKELRTGCDSQKPSQSLSMLWYLQFDVNYINEYWLILLIVCRALHSSPFSSPQPFSLQLSLICSSPILLFIPPIHQFIIIFPHLFCSLTYIFHPSTILFPSLCLSAAAPPHIILQFPIFLIISMYPSSSYSTSFAAWPTFFLPSPISFPTLSPPPSSNPHHLHHSPETKYYSAINKSHTTNHTS